MYKPQSRHFGFSLIELMVVVVMLAILVAMLLPSYQMYLRKAEIHQTQQYMLHLSMLLERHKAKNFSYRGFAMTHVDIPENVAAAQVKYRLTLVDGDQTQLALSAENARGQHWSMRAQPMQAHYPTLLLTSFGLRCQNDHMQHVDFQSCGTVGQEHW